MEEIESPTRHDPGRAALGEAIGLYNAGDYFEAHEVLEVPWRTMEGTERLVYQGLIQVAMGYRHATRERWHGAAVLLRRALEKLEPRADAFPFLPLRAFVGKVRATLEVIAAREAGRDRDAPLAIPSLPPLGKD